MPKGTRKQYTPEFKFKLIEESLKNENMTAVARKYGVNKKHPENKHIKDKIRQQLQVLRDKGYLEFIERGRYRLT